MKVKQFIAAIALLMAVCVLSSCNDEVDYNSDIIGIWQLNATLEDGNDVPLSNIEKNTKIIFKENGLYQLYNANDSLTVNGTWLYTPSDRLDLSMDRKNNADRHKYDAYEPCAVVFIIEDASSTNLQIINRTTVDERKRFVMFTTKDDDKTYTDLVAAIAAETDVDQKRILQRELMDMDQKMVTYSFTFSRINP